MQYDPSHTENMDWRAMLLLLNDTIDASITYIQHLDINPGTPATTNAGVKVR